MKWLPLNCHRRKCEVDDEPPIRKLLRMGLATQGYAVLEAPDARTALALLGREGVDLVILDLGLPDMRGHDLLRSVRTSHPDLPVVVLSSRDDEGGKVEALDLGANDYVTKPFGMAELLARLRAAMRHQLAARGERPIFRVDNLSVDLVRRIVKVDEAEVKLTPREYDFLRVLVLHAGKVADPEVGPLEVLIKVLGKVLSRCSKRCFYVLIRK